MHPRQYWLALSLLAALSVQAAVIYRWVDADGVVHYSDQQTPGAERIVTSAPNTSAAGARAPANSSPQGPAKPANASAGYNDFSITSPQSEQTFLASDPIPVHLNLAPGLQPGQIIVWHMNGKQLDEQQNSMSFTISQLDRGTYSLMATVTDQQTGATTNSNSVTFFVRQTSSLSPQSPLRK